MVTKEHGLGSRSEAPIKSKDDSMLSPGDISFAGNDFDVTSTFATTKLATTKLVTTKLATTKAASNPVINQNAEALSDILQGFQNVESSLQEMLTVLEDISNKTGVSSTKIAQGVHILRITILYIIIHHMI